MQHLRTIVAGGRDFSDGDLMEHVLRNIHWKISEVICGTARGADQWGEHWAYEREVPVKRFFAAWDKLGKSAGYRRNLEMAENAEALVAFWDGKSKGTKHMIDIALSKGLTVLVVPY